MEKHGVGLWNSLSPLGKKITLAMGVILAFVAYSMFVSQKEERFKIPVVLSQGDAVVAEFVSSKLKIDILQAKKVSAYVEKTYSGSKKPVQVATLQASTNEELVRQLEDKVKNKDPTLPKSFTLDSDRTMIVPFDKKTTEKTGMNAGVYKIWTAPKIQKEIGVNINPSDFQNPDYVRGSYAYRITPTDKKPVYIVVGGMVDLERKGIKGDLGIRW